MEKSPRAFCSENRRPDTRKPLSTKKRSTPTQPPRCQGARINLAALGKSSGGAGTCRPRTSATAVNLKTSKPTSRGLIASPRTPAERKAQATASTRLLCGAPLLEPSQGHRVPSKGGLRRPSLLSDQPPDPASRERRMTVPIARKTSAREIFDRPWRLSSKMMGVSATRPPLLRTRKSISTWKE